MIIWYKHALKQLEKLPQNIQKQIKTAVERLPYGDVKALKGSYKGAYRLRVGNWRVLFFYSNDDIVIFGVKHRSKAYR